MQVRIAAIAVMAAGTLLAGSSASAAELKVLTTGAMRPIVMALVSQFESQGHKVTVENVTAGGLVKRIEGGEAFDVAISPTTKEADAAKALLGLLAGPAGATVLREKGMERPS